MADSHEVLSENQREKKSGSGAYIAVIILLLLVIGFMVYLLADKNKEITNRDNDIKVLNTDMNGMNEMLEGYVGNLSNDLKSDFKNMLSTYDALIEKDASKADSINVQKERIQGLLDDLKNNKNLSARQIMLLKKENETLRDIMKGYVVQIDKLNTLNLQLESDLDSTSTQLQMTEEERARLEEENTGQSELIDKAKKLDAFNFSSGANKAKLGGTMATTTKARNAVQLKSSFTISENALTAKGSKTVYMQVIDPNGKTISLRSGNITTIGSSQVAYTNKRDINYTGGRIDVSIYQDLNEMKISKGNYKVKIYCQGQLIGTDSFTLK
ncbi:MAG: hypothetical protein ACI865_000147 [Flavobacteriaceae bacterium]|jgi:hypothetical protein